MVLASSSLPTTELQPPHTEVVDSRGTGSNDVNVWEVFIRLESFICSGHLHQGVANTFLRPKTEYYLVLQRTEYKLNTNKAKAISAELFE